MKILLFSLIFAVLSCCLSIPFVIRACARTLADDIIEGKQSGTEKQINRYIHILSWTSRWISDKAHKDLNRVRKLNNMVKEMQNPHG
jgi:hypothetical protein